MSDRDDAIGRSLARMRGAMTQQDLAQLMRDKGWKWSQATVWSIEKGDRPLRLSEALDVSAILGTTIDGLLGAPRGIDERREMESEVTWVERHFEEVELAAANLLAAQQRLSTLVDQFGAEDFIDEGLRKRAANRLTFSPEGAVADSRRARKEKLENPPLIWGGGAEPLEGWSLEAAQWTPEGLESYGG